MAILKRVTAKLLPALTAALVATMPARASAPLLIWPIDPSIEAGRDATALWLENRGTAQAMMQIRIYRWRQHEGEDRFEEQNDVDASPPIVTIPAGKRQMIRLINPRGRRESGETAYRIVVDEIPLPSAVSSAESDDSAAPPPPPSRTGGGLSFQMRYSIPLFIYAGAGRDAASLRMPPQLRCTLAAQPDGKYLRLSNVGPVNARLLDLAFDRSGSKAPLGEGLLGYVLPGATVARRLPPDVTGRGPLHMRGRGGEKISIPGCADG